MLKFDNKIARSPRICQWGVEVEMEGRNIPDRVHGWTHTNDGSLRGESAEFIFAEPALNTPDAKDLIDALHNALGRNDTVIRDSIRAGVHIHYNVSHLTWRELFVIATAYYCLEECLVDACGPDRQGNPFCLRVRDAEAVLETLEQCIMTGETSILNLDTIKYAALNFNSIHRHGSLEFRALRTPTDVREIKKWIDILDNLYSNALRYETPIAVVEGLSYGGEENFARTLLGEHHSIVTANPEFQVKIRRGVRYAQDLAYITNQWT